MRKNESVAQLREKDFGGVVRINDIGYSFQHQNVCNDAKVVEEKNDVSRVKRLSLALDDGLAKSIFDHLRNYLMCSFLLAVGVTEFKQAPVLSFDFFVSNYAAVAIIVLSCVLFCLNLFDGIRQISQYKYHSAYTFGLIVSYVILSVGVIDLAANFRTAF